MNENFDFIVNKAIAKCENNNIDISTTEGIKRRENGEKYENLVKELIKDIAKIVNIDIEIKDGQNKIYYEGIPIALDINVYKDKKLILCIECKTYLDVTMFKRTYFECGMLKKQYNNLYCGIVQFENSLTKTQTDFIKKDNIIDGIFTISGKNRRSKIENNYKDLLKLAYNIQDVLIQNK